MSAYDPFKLYLPTAVSPARKAAAITPDDDADLATAIRMIELAEDGVAGAVYFVLVDDPDGAVVSAQIDHGQPITGRMIRRVKATGTTATGLVGYL